jgi:vesicular inhibitory amino acid transporter
VIAFEASGNIGRYLVMFASYLQLFGVAVIFLLIASQNLASVLNSLISILYFCDYTIIITVLMIPIAMLGTPKDFWPIAVSI